MAEALGVASSVLGLLNIAASVAIAAHQYTRAALEDVGTLDRQKTDAETLKAAADSMRDGARLLGAAQPFAIRQLPPLEELATYKNEILTNLKRLTPPECMQTTL